MMDAVLEETVKCVRTGYTQHFFTHCSFLFDSGGYRGGSRIWLRAIDLPKPWRPDSTLKYFTIRGENFGLAQIKMPEVELANSVVTL